METNLKQLSDLEVINLCIHNDKNYFSELVSRYKNLVYSVILRMINDAEEANDLAQEVFVKVFKNLDKYQPDFKFSTWIIRITTNHVIDYRRKHKQETVPIDDVSYEIAANDSPEEEFISKEQHNSVIGVLNKLPDMYRIPIVLYHQQGLSYQEIAEIIEEPLSKVKNRIFRGRKMLKESLLMKEGGSFGL